MRVSFVVVLSMVAATVAVSSVSPEPSADKAGDQPSGSFTKAPASAGQAATPVTPVADLVLGKAYAFESRVLGRSITLEIALPPGYDGGLDRYPVLYAFQSRLASVFGVVDTLGRAAAAPEMIVVAVGVPGDLFALHPREGVPGPGRGPDVLTFLRAELEPFVDTTYRTVPYRVVLGHSASSVFALWALFSAPDAVQAVLAAGPMFPEYDYGRVAAMIESAIASRSPRPQFLFLTQGNQPELDRDLRAFRDLLRARSPAGLVWEFDPEPMSNHNSLGLRTLHDGLWLLFADWSTLPEAVAAAGADAIRAHRDSLALRFGYPIGLSRLADNRVRAKWAADGNHDGVLALARFGCEEWPRDHWRRQQLALACERAGRWNDAMTAWEAALDVARAHAPDRDRESVLARYERRLAEARARAMARDRGQP